MASTRGRTVGHKDSAQSQGMGRVEEVLQIIGSNSLCYMSHSGVRVMMTPKELSRNMPLKTAEHGDWESDASQLLRVLLGGAHLNLNPQSISL